MQAGLTQLVTKDDKERTGMEQGFGQNGAGCPRRHLEGFVGGRPAGRCGEGGLAGRGFVGDRVLDRIVEERLVVISDLARGVGGFAEMRDTRKTGAETWSG